MIRHDGELRLADWFCGAGGSAQAIASIPASAQCMREPLGPRHRVLITACGLD